jgi:hypothetical protein
VNFDPTFLFLSMVMGAIGMGLFVYGKKQSRIVPLVGGLALMVYPYFVESLTALSVVGVGICVATYFAARAD